MANIKTKDSKPKTIKTLNKAVVGTQNIKDNIVSTKEKINENTPNKNDENNIEYGSNTITGASSITASTVATKFNKYGKKSFEETKENIIKSKVKVNSFTYSIQHLLFVIPLKQVGHSNGKSLPIG